MGLFLSFDRDPTAIDYDYTSDEIQVRGMSMPEIIWIYDLARTLEAHREPSHDEQMRYGLLYRDRLKHLDDWVGQYDQRLQSMRLANPLPKK